MLFSTFFVVSINDAHALLVSQDPVGEMDVVVVGTIISAVSGADSYGVPETKYVVDIEEIVKGYALLQDGVNAKSLEFVAPGVLNAQDNPVYTKIFAAGDRVLLILEQKGETLRESLWSRDAPNSCSGNEVIQMIDAPGGLSISQDVLDGSNFYTNHPISAQYSFFNKNLAATTLNVTINVVDDFPDIYHSESFVLNLDECQAYETVETKFAMNEPSSISIHTIVDGESSHGISGLDVVEYILSPLKQFNSGIPSDEIPCKENLVLIQKHNDYPACVKQETREKLIERGWATESELKLISESFAIFYAAEERGWTEEDFTTYDSHAILLKIKNDGFAFEVELDTLKEKDLYMTKFNEYDEDQYIWLVSLTENKEYKYHVDAITGKVLLAARDGTIVDK